MTPEEYWKEAQRGSESAWKELYSLFGSRLNSFFLKNTGDIEISMDKTQEVFEKLFRKKEMFSDGSLKCWVFRIAKNLLIDWWRSKQRHYSDNANIENVEIAGNEPPVDYQVIEKLDREELLRYVDETLELLEFEDRIAIGLVYLGGLTVSEYSQLMDLPLGTAKTRVRHARLQLDSRISSKCAMREVKNEK
ncbi:MAG: RNA polymerase sigma factor [Candidatus Riflebacteria bacterium]|nr:RNA polymerase sigma factor [Candidatus Riflebacteria bacterium]